MNESKQKLNIIFLSSGVCHAVWQTGTQVPLFQMNLFPPSWGGKFHHSYPSNYTDSHPRRHLYPISLKYILVLVPGFSSQYHSLRFLHQNAVCVFHLSYSCHMPACLITMTWSPCVEGLRKILGQSVFQARF